jgi:hypothetical protein
MTTQDVADKLVKLCKEGKSDEAVDSLYSNDIVSVESMAGPDGSREMKGLEAAKAKGKWWYENHQIHSAKVEGPLVAGPFFSVRFTYDITHKPSGNRMVMDELAMYHVTGGKIDREEFFYPTA